jgi:hypothetical protein
MKVKNYNKGNYIDAFSCIIYGEIEMTWKEWLEAKRYLLLSGGDYTEKRMLREDIERSDRYLKLSSEKVIYRNVRVSYIEKLFKHFNLPRYKKQNYVIKIITK